MDKPLPFITSTPDRKFSLHPEAVAYLSKINGPIGVVAVAGLARFVSSVPLFCFFPCSLFPSMNRTGKSYLLNRLNGQQMGFDVGPSINPCTKGIYIWGVPKAHVSSNGEKMTLLLLDTEGIGATDRDKTHDAKIFSLALLLSSYFIYNSLGTIDEQAIEGISLVANLTKHIHVRSAPSSKSSSTTQQEEGDYQLAALLPKFLWVVRDFVLELEDMEGRSITSQQYLENALQPVPSRREERGEERTARESKNKVRTVIRNCFVNRDCQTLVRPVNGK
jgi:hypothetical protein